MAPKKDGLRKAYEFKIGKERTSKLSDQQINLLSKYYNSLSEKEQQNLDSLLFQGRTCELTEMADSFISETQGNVGGGVSVYKPGDKFEDDMKEFVKEQEEKFEEKLEETSDSIMDAIDELIAADKKRFEDFKKQEAKRLADSKRERDQKEREEDRLRKEVDQKIEDAAIASRIKEILGKQYDVPIGPKQNPDKIKKIKSGLIGTTNVLNPEQISDKYDLQKQAPIPAWTNIIKPPVNIIKPLEDDEWEGETNDLLEGKLDNLIESIKNEPSVEPKKTKKSKKSKTKRSRKTARRSRKYRK